MKPTLIVIGTIALSLLAACASKDETTTTQSATPAPESPNAAQGSAKASAVAQIGGQVVLVGEHQVELKLFRDGYAEALIFDAQGKAIAKPEAAKLTAHAVAKGDAKKDIALAWQPPMARFAADGRAGAELEAKPVDIELAFDGAKAAHGTLDAAVLLVGPELGGTLVVAGEHGIEIVANADGRVDALVNDRFGVRVSGDANAKLEVELTGVDGKLHAMALAWDEARACFSGKADAGLKLAAGPAKLGLAGKAKVSLPNLALSAKAEHKGRVLVAGDYSVELVADGNTLIAYAFDASAKAYAKGDLDLSVRLGSNAFVKLTWDAPSLSYRAKIEGDFDLDVQPIVLSLKAEGKAHVGASFRASAKLDANANAKAKADVNAKAGGDAKLEAKAPEVKAKAGLTSNAKAGAKTSAKANVQPPKVNVQAPKVNVQKSASSSSGGGKAKASAGFSIGVK
jgi:hypothetical protein